MQIATFYLYPILFLFVWIIVQGNVFSSNYPNLGTWLLASQMCKALSSYWRYYAVTEFAIQTRFGIKASLRFHGPIQWTSKQLIGIHAHGSFVADLVFQPIQYGAPQYRHPNRSLRQFSFYPQPWTRRFLLMYRVFFYSYTFAVGQDTIQTISPPIQTDVLYSYV